MAPRERHEAEEEEEMDPDYKFFLNHLRPSGTTYVLEIDGRSINYEEEVVDNESPLPSINRNNYNHTKKNTKKKDKESHILEAIAGTSSMDKNYGKFLHHLRRLPDGSVVLDLDNGIHIQYAKKQTTQQEEGEGNVSETEGHVQVTNFSTATRARNHSKKLMKILEDNASQNKASVQATNFSTIGPAGNHSGCSAEYSPFKTKLMKILERPFDQGEYDELMKEANTRKPMVNDKHLRAGDISYKSGTMGLSYFEYHPDLAKKVKRADQFRGLNLLRGFFFWLQHLGNEGSYRPWVSKLSHRRTQL